MALIKCPECGKEISDKASACPNCGCPISSSQSLSSVAGKDAAINKAEKKKKTGIVIGLAAALVLFGIALGVYFAFLSPAAKTEKAYVEAKTLLSSGQYEVALSRFEELENYKDSKEMVSTCLFDMGKNEMQNENWEEAISYFEASGFSDSEEKIKESKYNLGINAMNSFDWETASLYFTGLSYEESDKMLRIALL